MNQMASTFTAPGLDQRAAAETIELLQGRMTALIDTALTLKHVHWNVVGPTFIGVHEMLDPQVDAVRDMVDEIAERIATLGGEPVGTPGFITQNRTWDDYPLRRDTVANHLVALDSVYVGVITDMRSAAARLAEIDPVSEDLVIGMIRQLEQFQWFVRAHLENASGRIDPTHLSS
jgi:starvation-inducible DNA-binding protein